MGDAALDRFGFSTVRPGVRVHLAFRRQSPQSQSTPLRLFPPRSGSERDAAPAFIRALACRLLHTGWRGESSGDPLADGNRKSAGPSGRDITRNKTCADPTGATTCAGTCTDGCALAHAAGSCGLA